MMAPRQARSQRLFFHIFWRVVPVITVVFLLLGFQASRSIRTIEETEAHAWLARQGDYAVTQIMHPIRLVIAEAASLAGNDLVVNGLIDTEDRNAYLPPFFRSLRLPGPEGARVFMLDYRGRIIATNLPGRPTDWNPDDWAAAIGRNVVSTSLSAAGLTALAPIRYQKRAEGAILIHYPAAKLGELFSFADFPLATALTQADGRVIFSSDPAFATVGVAFSNTAPDDWVITEQAIPGLEGLRLVAASRTRDVLDTVYEIGEIVIVILLLSISALIGTAGLAALVATREVGRLGRLIRGIGGVDDMNRRLDVRGPRELRDLGDSFNAMLDILELETTSRDYVDSILNSLAEILIVASPEGRIRTTNPAAHRFLREMGILENGPVSAIFRADSYGPRDDPATFLDWIGGALTLEATYAKPSGEKVTILWLKSLLRDQRSGITTGSVFVGQDISERIRIERLKSEFISTVSHELRTPLTSIAGTLGLLKGGVGGPLPEKARELIAIGHNNSNRLIALINDLLDIQKIEAGGMEFRMKPVRLERIVKTAIAQMHSYAANRNVAFTCCINDGLALVEGDADRIEQVMANLLSNAAKFSPEGAEVTVTLRTDGAEAVVAVADSGPGIPAEFRSRIFHRFAQADSSDTRRKGGTGLGLAIVRAIVEHHGGRVWYESEPGQGATFYFTLPLLGAAAAERMESAGAR